MTEDTESRAKLCAERHPDGRFITTGGRPVGSRNKITKKSARAITDLHDLAFKKLKELLEAGHPGITEFVIRSLLPTGGRAVQLDSLDVDSLLDATANGVISPAELRQLASAIEKIRNVESLDKLADRLAEVERLLKDS